MRCLSCLTVNPDGNRFCENCGMQLKTSCPDCGNDCLPSARFCGACGKPLTAGLRQSPVAAESMPKWGELKQATVLFADIVGSTEHIAGLDAEQAMERMRPAVLRMCDSVERFGGTVVRTLGDGVMALFGVPHTLEGHARLACEAALHMQKAFRQDPQWLTIRVGLHSGQVASDPRDAQDGKGGGAHGFSIHVASRVVGLAQPGGICLTEACRALVGPACETVSMGAHQLKGISEAVDIHALTGLKTLASHQQLHGTALTPFRGRQHELQRLVQAMEASECGDAKVIGIAGEPGAGKSRLCQELAQACRARGIAVYQVRAQLYGHAMPLQPVLELFRSHFFRIAANADSAAARQRIAQTMSRLGPTDVDLALLYEFFGAAQPDVPPLPSAAKVRQSRLLALLSELVRLDADTPRLILFEDLHWLDEASEEFVHALVKAVAGTRSFLLLNYRPAYRCPWIGLAHFEEMELRELPAADIGPLVADLIAPWSRMPQIRELVARRSAGNPFFAEELARTLAESGVLSAHAKLPPGGMEAVERALPATVQAVIGARLDRIGEPEKTLLQMCAIIGKDIPLAVLEDVASPLAGQIEQGLSGLCQAGLILPQPVEGGRQFAFRHPLIQEVAYSTQLKVRRGTVHAAAAVAMEAYYREHLDEYAGLVAYHYEQAGQHLLSARYNARAADWVGSTNAAQAIKHWRKVRSLLSREDGAEANRLRAMAGGKIAWLGWREGLTQAQVQPFIDEALALSADPRLTQLLLMAEGRILQASGASADLYVSRVEQALSLAGSAAQRARAVTLQAALSQAYGWAGLLKKALQANDLALAHISEVDPFDAEFIGFSIQHWVLAMRGRLLTRLGRFDEARRCLEQLIELSAQWIDPVIIQMPRYACLELAVYQGDADLAARQLDHVTDIATKYDNPYLRVFALNGSALVKRLRSDHRGAAADLGDALSLVRGGNVAMEFETEILAGLAESQLEAGRYELALATSKEAAVLSEKRGNRLPRCRALSTWRQALLAEPGLDEVTQLSALQTEIEDLIALTGVQTCGCILNSQASAIAVD